TGQTGPVHDRRDAAGRADPRGAEDPLRRRRLHHLGLREPDRRLPRVRRGSRAGPHRSGAIGLRVPPGLVEGGRVMLRYILRRLAISVVILFLVSVLVFVATLLLPGDPAQAILGQQATPARLAALREQMHL